MKLNVRLFARARDLAGGDHVQVELADGARVSDLRAALAQTVPALKPLASSLLIAVGTDYAAESQRVDPNREIACFPPVSGG